MRSATDRRALLHVVGGSAAVALAAPAAIAGNVDPHPEWARQARAISDQLDTPGLIADEDSGLWCDRMNHWHDLVIDTPAQTLAGVREQIAYVARSIEHNCPSEREEKALRNALATLEQLAEETTHA